jgi:hypothetical protein
MSDPAELEKLGVRCESYTTKGERCRRWGRCWDQRLGRHCVQHMRRLDPRNAWWWM